MTRKEQETKLIELFEKLVPSMGNANTIQGELVRAANRLGYRWFNDGDKFYEGYGCETCGPVASFLMKCQLLKTSFRSEATRLINDVQSTYTDSHYEQFLEDINNLILDYLDNNPELIESNVDMFDFESQWEDYDDYDDEDDYWMDEEE